MTVAVAGATGYIGKAVVRECVRRGFKTKAYVREESMERAKSLEYLKGAQVRWGPGSLCASAFCHSAHAASHQQQTAQTAR
jgi:nucleoside-diphosphate-sugar epimerase